MSTMEIKIIGVVLICVTVVFVLLYLWFIRGKLLEKSFESFIGEEGVESPRKIEGIDTGKVMKSLLFNSVEFKLYSIFNGGVNRFHWYLIISYPQVDTAVSDGIYGKGYLADSWDNPYIDLNRIDEKIYLEDWVPNCWESVSVIGGKPYVCYRLPEIIGTGKLDLVQVFKKHSNG